MPSRVASEIGRGVYTTASLHSVILWLIFISPFLGISWSCLVEVDCNAAGGSGEGVGCGHRLIWTRRIARGSVVEKQPTYFTDRPCLL